MTSSRAALLGPPLLAITLTACSHVPPHAPLAPDSVFALRHQIDALIDAPALSRGYWGVSIHSLRHDDLLYEHDARKLLLPASNMKIVTLAVAAARLGWDFTYSTRAFAGGPIVDGTLRGDLLVVGSGDPSVQLVGAKQAASGRRLSTFDVWADHLARQGIRKIDGRIVGDDTAFDDEPLGFGWSWDDLSDDYAAGVGALQFNESWVRVTVTPGHVEQSLASIEMVPEGSGLIVDNLVTTSAAAVPASIGRRRQPGSARLMLDGTIPLGGDPVALDVAVVNPTEYFVTEFRRALIDHGIDVSGAAVSIHNITDPSAPVGQPILDAASPPLRNLAVRLMKSSQNQYAETLLKTIAAHAGSGTWENGRKLALETLTSWGIGSSDIVMADGSGLSRYDYVTADAIVRVLAHVYADERMREPFVASLPIAGQDGTLSTRMKGTAAAGNARAKTGSMTRVRSISGYVQTADGEPVVFSIIANNFDVAPEEIDKTSDAIVIALARFTR